MKLTFKYRNPLFLAKAPIMQLFIINAKSKASVILMLVLTLFLISTRTRAQVKVMIDDKLGESFLGEYPVASWNKVVILTGVKYSEIDSVVMQYEEEKGNGQMQQQQQRQMSNFEIWVDKTLNNISAIRLSRKKKEGLLGGKPGDPAVFVVPMNMPRKKSSFKVTIHFKTPVIIQAGKAKSKLAKLKFLIS